MSESESPHPTPSVTTPNLKKALTDATYAVPARTVSARHGSQWISEGWRLLKDKPLVWFTVVLLYLGITFVLELIPVLGSLASFLLAPSLSVGILAVGQSHSHQGEADIAKMLSGFNGEKIRPLMIMALLNLAIFLGAVFVLLIFMAIAMGGVATLGSLITEEGFRSALQGEERQIMMMGIFMFIIVLMATTAAYWFAPGLIFYAGQRPVDAMKESCMACMRNWRPFLVYSLLATLLMVAACIPFGLGLLPFMPFMMATMYPGFEDLFEQTKV